jgi:hypothetical protein
MSATVADLATNIADRGRSGLTVAAREFEDESIEQIILNHDLKEYRKDTDTLQTRFPRDPSIVYSDADLCVFHLTTDEASSLVYGDRDWDAPAWWLLGQDVLRDCGFVLMEFPNDKRDTTAGWTRTAVLEALNLDGWQTLSADQIANLDVGRNYRVSGRLSVERYDPDEWLERRQQNNIDIDWDYMEQQRATTATRLADHLLTFEDAADLVQTFDPLRESHPFPGLQQTAYIPDETTVYTVSEYYRNRKFTLSEGVYIFRRLARCRHHSARSPQTE